MSPQNPFSSVRVRPGALPFLFRAGQSAALLVERLRANRWQGQIIGPHGTGKSTLLHALAPAIESAGRRVAWVRAPGCPALPEEAVPHSRGATGPVQYIVDGFEQFGPLARLGWKIQGRWPRCGLLVTAHQDVGLPTLYETDVDDELAQRVARQLLANDGQHIAPSDVTTALHEHQGNLRDALFALYDLYEQRRHTGG